MSAKSYPVLSSRPLAMPVGSKVSGRPQLSELKELKTPTPRGASEEGVKTAQNMKVLTARYGTRGKSAKSVFLQGFRDEVRGKGRKNFLKVLQSEDPEEIKCLTYQERRAQEVITGTSNSKSSDSSRILTRPAAMVLYSKFCTRLEMLTKNQIFHHGLVPPPNETSWLYDEARQDSFKTDAQGETSLADTPFQIIGVENLLEESEEKMVLRLKLYKRAFSALILHCEALRPLLREIKRSYDAVLKLRERQLMEISWVSQNIGTAEKELQERTSNVGFEGHGIIKLIENQCKQLTRHIDKQDAAIRIMTEILNALENALGEEHELRRDSDDQNKMFIKDINDIRKKLGMPPRPEEVAEAVAVEEVRAETGGVVEFNYTPDDALILRKALDICRLDLYRANLRMEKLEEEHKNEIPRHVFEEMQRDLARLEEDNVKLKKLTEDTISQVQGIKDQIGKLTSERDDMKKVAADLRVKITPRPSWDRVGEYVEGGLPKWKSVYEGKTSIEISAKVLEELNSKKTAGPPEYLSAFGADPEIPRCLRHDTRVRDRRLARRDAEVIVHDIWKRRIEQLANIKSLRDKSSTVVATTTTAKPLSMLEDFEEAADGIPPITDFPEFIAQYFEDLFPDVQLRMEWTYNLVDAAKRLTMNQKLSQFLGILMGRIEEGCYHMLRSELARFHQLLRARTAEVGAPEGQMSLGDFRQLLEVAYPFKQESEVKALVRVISKQTKAHAEWTLLNYEQLFKETDEGFEGEFVEEFSRQLDEDRLKYIHQIIQGLLTDLAISSYDYEREEESPVGEMDVHMSKFYKALVAVDPQMTEETIGGALAWVYARTSVLPNLGPRGIPLVNFIRNRLGSDDPWDDPASQVEFEMAVEEIRNGFAKSDEEEGGGGRGKKKGQTYHVPKVLKLRVLIRRFKETAILRQGTRLKGLLDSRGNYPGEHAGEMDEGIYEWPEDEEEYELEYPTDTEVETA